MHTYEQCFRCNPLGGIFEYTALQTDFSLTHSINYIRAPRWHLGLGFHKRAPLLSVCSPPNDGVPYDVTHFDLFFKCTSPRFFRTTSSPSAVQRL